MCVHVCVCVPTSPAVVHALFNLALCHAMCESPGEALGICSTLTQASAGAPSEDNGVSPDVVPRCLQLQAALFQRSGRLDVSRTCLSAASAFAKQHRSDAMVSVVQQCTQQLLTLALQSLSPTDQTLIERLVAVSGPTERSVVQQVVQRLFACDDLSEYVQALVRAVHTTRGSASASQLSAVVTLCLSGR
jgi:hypothetical protein